MTDLAFLIARLILGLGMAAHGTQKLFGWFGGHGLSGTAGFFEMLGFRPGRIFALAASSSEIASGLLIALGLLGPVGPAIMISVMLVAGISVHGKNGFFAAANGFEMTALYATAALILGFSGPGNLSLDTLLHLNGIWTPARDGLVIGLGIVGGLLNLAVRRPVAATQATT